MTLLALGILAGVIQARGYSLYINATKKHSITPSPTTWFIFSFDVFILTILEAGAGAQMEDLIVPAVCTVGAIWMAITLCIEKGQIVRATRLVKVSAMRHIKKWELVRAARFAFRIAMLFIRNARLPQDKSDRTVLLIAMVIVIGYFPLWFLGEVSTIIPKEIQHQAALWFLVLSTVNTVIGFWPTVKNYEHEHPGAWFVWTVAYTILLYIMISRKEPWGMLYAYPISSIFFHGLVGVLSLKPFIRKMKALVPSRSQAHLKWDRILFHIFF